MSYPYSQIFPPPDRFGDIIGGDYSEFEPDGFLIAKGGAIGYKDLDIGGVSLGAGATAPDLAAILGGTILVPVFDGNATTEQLFGCKELDHDWAEGTDITPHIHWMPTTANAGDVIWQLTYTWIDGGVVAPAPQTIQAPQNAGGAAWTQQFVNFPAIAGAGHTIGSQFAFRLWRNPGIDAYPDDAALLTFGIHIQVNSLGSRNISSK